VHLQDCDGQKVRNRKVPLKVTLCYRNNGVVPQQSILQLSPDTRAVIDEHFGESLIKFRVNEVSTRHQGQMFQVLVAPDLTVAPSAADIMSVFCTPVDVKSKRNNHRDRQQQQQQMMQQTQMQALGSNGGILRSSSGLLSASTGVRKGDMDGSDIPLKRVRSGEFSII
jgi:hypothetical protein